MEPTRWWTHPSAKRPLLDTASQLLVEGVARLRDKDLRATAVMWLAQAGCTNTLIASITGHTLKTVDAILKHYWAASAAQADDAMAKMIAWHMKQKS